MWRVFVAVALGAVVMSGQTPGRQAPASPSFPPRDNPIRDDRAASQAGTGSIRGRVVTDAADPADAAALPKARVTLTGPTIVDPIFTDASGRFEFRGLGPGAYVLTAEKTGYVRTRYRSRSSLDPAIEIEVAEGGTVEPVDVRLAKGAAIVGRITDSGGDPVVGAEVLASAVQAIGGELRLAPIAQPIVETDDLGEYRIGDLPAGRYIVDAAGAGLGSLPDGMPREWERLVSWARTFYPGVAGLSGAIPVTVGTGEERSGVDFAVVQSGQPQLRLTVTGLSGGPSVGNRGFGGPPVTVTFVAADTSFGAAVEQNLTMSFSSNADIVGTTIQPKLDPGEWIAVARQAGAGAILHFTVPTVPSDVPGDDVDAEVPISLALVSGSHITGRVVFTGARPAPPMSAVHITVHGAGPNAALSTRALTQSPVTPTADGTFHVENVFGPIALEADAPPGWTLNAVQYRGRDLLDEPLTLESGADAADVQVMLTDQVATLSGSTVDAASRPAPGCSVGIFPDLRDFHFNPRRMRLKRSNQLGRFTMPDLPSGRYLVAAAPTIDASVWLTADGLDQLRSRARSVSLSDGETKTITLPCLTAP